MYCSKILLLLGRLTICNLPCEYIVCMNVSIYISKYICIYIFFPKKKKARLLRTSYLK